jgi:hypothetical protein
MALPGKRIKAVVKRHATNHQIQTYTAGVADPLSNTPGTINIHHQPIGDGKLIKSLNEGQRLQDMKKGWTIEPIKEKDIININGFGFTVNAVQEWTSHTEVDLWRSGEQDNIWT